MATKVTKPPRTKGVHSVKASTESAVTIVSARATGQVVGKVRFGRVVVEAAKPSAAETRINIDAGRSALVRAKTALTRPGVQVRVDPKVPLYRADPSTPGILVRTLNGRTTRGRFVAGRFKPI